MATRGKKVTDRKDDQTGTDAEKKTRAKKSTDADRRESTGATLTDVQRERIRNSIELMGKTRPMRIDELLPYQRNQKDHPEEQVKNLANSLRRFGWRQPVVIDERNVIVIGHGRVLGAKMLGLEEAPVVSASDLTEDEIRELRIIDNKTNESTWNEYFEEDVKELDFEGFDFPDFDALSGGGSTSHDIEEDEYDEELPEEPKAVRGDIYQLGRHRLMCGDATSIDDIKKLMDGKKADLLLTDPPYNVDYTGKTKDQLKIEGDVQSDGEFRQFLRDAFSGADTVMRPGACFYIWHADSEGYNFRGACHDCGWDVRQCLIWNKNSLVMGRQDYQWKHEPCLYGWKDGAGHTWVSDRKQVTVLEYDRPQRNDIHPTMKPVKMFGYLIENNTRDGDIVLDLFNGSGSTIIACEQTERCAYTMDLDPRYVDAAIDRWEKFTGEKAVRLG